MCAPLSATHAIIADTVVCAESDDESFATFVVSKSISLPHVHAYSHRNIYAHVESYPILYHHTHSHSILYADAYSYANTNPYFYACVYANP